MSAPWPDRLLAANPAGNATANAGLPPSGPAPISMPAVLASAALVAADAVVSWSLGLGVHWQLVVGVVR